MLYKTIIIGFYLTIANAAYSNPYDAVNKLIAEQLERQKSSESFKSKYQIDIESQINKVSEMRREASKYPNTRKGDELLNKANAFAASIKVTDKIVNYVGMYTSRDKWVASFGNLNEKIQSHYLPIETVFGNNGKNVKANVIDVNGNLLSGLIRVYLPKLSTGNYGSIYPGDVLSVSGDLKIVSIDASPGYTFDIENASIKIIRKAD